MAGCFALLLFTSPPHKHIRFVVTNKEDILYKVKPYFSLLYGQKKLAFNKLERMYSLIKNPTLNNHPDLISELIHLVYYLNPEGQQQNYLYKTN